MLEMKYVKFMNISMQK